MKGHFITFEGGEGAGKSTLIRNLTRELSKQGYTVVTTREPGGTALGEYIRECLLNSQFKENLGPKAELLLFLSSRAQHIEELIAPALKKGSIVLCDRFNDSTIAYQGGGRELGIEYVTHLCYDVCQGVVPELTFFLDLEPETGLARRKKANRETDRIESEALTFHERVRRGFHQLAKQDKGRVHTIDASKSIESVYQEVLNIILEKIA
jgi:dTMP kinase